MVLDQGLRERAFVKMARDRAASRTVLSARDSFGIDSLASVIPSRALIGGTVHVRFREGPSIMRLQISHDFLNLLVKRIEWLVGYELPGSFYPLMHSKGEI
jgi:hypothetical protein